MQTLIVIVIVLLAAIWLGWRFYKKIVQNNKTEGCSGGCCDCSLNQDLNKDLINSCPGPDSEKSTESV